MGSHFFRTIICGVILVWFGASLGTVQAAYRPAIPKDSWVGVYTRNEESGLYIKHDVTVIDYDGVADDGSSHTVQVRYPDATVKIVPFDYKENAYTGHYWLSDTALQNGTYRYNVTDSGGNISINHDDQLTIKTIPVVNKSSITYTSDGTTPTIHWTPVASSDVTYYRVRIYSDVDTCIWRGQTTEGNYKVPPGVLAPNTSYGVKIEAHSDHDGLDWDNLSRCEFGSMLTTGAESQAPYCDLSFGRGVKAWKEVRSDPHLDCYVYVYDAQGAPDNIRSVTLTFPGGSPVIPLYYDYSPFSFQAVYRAAYFPAVPSGTYTVTVRDKDGHTYSDSQTLTPVLLSNLDKATMTPLHNSVMGADGVTFQWRPVPGAAFYDVRFMDQDQRTKYSFRVLDDTVTYLIFPTAILEKGKLYKYKINAWSDFWENDPQGGSNSDWDVYGFDLMTERLSGSSPPTIDLDKWGATLIHAMKPDLSGEYYMQEFFIRVSDPDGVPGNIKRVWVEYPDGSLQNLYFDRSQSATSGYYSWLDVFDSTSGVQNGAYVFYVEDGEGNTASVSDAFTVDPIPVPKDCRPPAGTIVPKDRATVGWAAVTGASKYRVRIFRNWQENKYTSSFGTALNHTVPADQLEAGTIYHYRVYATKEDPAVTDIDNYSINVGYQAMLPHFVVGDQSVSHAVPLSAGADALEYQIVSIPVQPVDPTAAAVLGSQIGGYDTSLMRIGCWDAASQSYVEYPAMNLEAGQAAWFLFRNGLTLNFQGLKTGAQGLPYGVRILQGWNQVGNPFAFPVDVADCRVQDGNGDQAMLTDSANHITQPVFWIYARGEYGSASTLDAAQGGWIKKLTVGAGQILFPAASSSRVPDRTPGYAPADYERPPAPPGGLESSSGMSGGGGGGCFIGTLKETVNRTD